MNKLWCVYVEDARHLKWAGMSHVSQMLNDQSRLLKNLKGMVLLVGAIKAEKTITYVFLAPVDRSCAVPHTWGH